MTESTKRPGMARQPRYYPRKGLSASLLPEGVEVVLAEAVARVSAEHEGDDFDMVAARLRTEMRKAVNGLPAEAEDYAGIAVRALFVSANLRASEQNE